MLVLALDTTGRSLSAALADGGTPLSEISLSAPGGHQKLVLEAVDALLRLSGLPLSAVEGLAVTTGPGSFSGVRLGVSVMKGLALGLERPVAGVPALSCLAAQAMLAGVSVWALMDSRRGEVYAAGYEPSPEGLVEISAPRVAKPLEIAAEILPPAILVGDGAVRYADVLAADPGRDIRLAPPGTHAVRAATVARLALPLLAAAKADSAETLAPLYLRPSDARLPARPLR